ncbi:hypothetical protein [Streptomyces sp. NPDC058486]
MSKTTKKALPLSADRVCAGAGTARLAPASAWPAAKTSKRRTP